MLIDWFTVFAQIVNFLILIWLLKKFLYGPIITAMDRREEKIASRLREALEKRNEAAKEIELYRQKNSEISKRRQELLRRAGQEADRLRKELIIDARKKADEARKRWHEAVGQEKQSFLKDMKKRAGRQVYAIARRALADLSGSDLERRIAAVFIKRIKGLSSEMRRRLSAGIGQEVVISSAFELAGDEKEKIKLAIHDELARDVNVRYETSPDLICGIELNSSGFLLGWSLREYLSSLEEEFGRLLEKKAAEE